MNCNFMNNSKTFCLSARHNLLEILFISSTAYTQQRLPKYGVTSFLASMVFPKDLQLHTVFNTLKILEGVVGKTGQGSTCEGIHAEVSLVEKFRFLLYVVKWNSLKRILVQA